MQVSLSVGAACALGAPWLQLISVALFIVVGALFLRNPGESLLTLTLLLIVFFLIEGSWDLRAFVIINSSSTD
jgi:uncharacterized membrane protein HdeD (DUF308 family)